MLTNQFVSSGRSWHLLCSFSPAVALAVVCPWLSLGSGCYPQVFLKLLDRCCQPGTNGVKKVPSLSLLHLPPRLGQSCMGPEPHGDPHGRDLSTFHSSPFHLACWPRCKKILKGSVNSHGGENHIFIFIHSFPLWIKITNHSRVGRTYASVQPTQIMSFHITLQLQKSFKCVHIHHDFEITIVTRSNVRSYYLMH